MAGERERFLSEIVGSILGPYEASEVYEEEIFGEFENQVEADCFNHFVSFLQRRHLILDLLAGTEGILCDWRSGRKMWWLLISLPTA